MHTAPLTPIFTPSVLILPLFIVSNSVNWSIDMAAAASKGEAAPAGKMPSRHFSLHALGCVPQHSSQLCKSADSTWATRPAGGDLGEMMKAELSREDSKRTFDAKAKARSDRSYRRDRHVLRQAAAAAAAAVACLDAPSRLLC